MLLEIGKSVIDEFVSALEMVPFILHSGEGSHIEKEGVDGEGRYGRV